MSVRRAKLERRARLELAEFPVDLAWSADGKVVIAGGDGALRIIDTREAAPTMQPLGSHAGGTLAVAWQGGGKLIASSGHDGEVRLWDARTAEARVIHRDHSWTEQLAFSSNGRLLAAATGRTLRVFDAAGVECACFTDHPGVIAAIVWKPKGAEVAALGNGGVRIHRVQPAPAQSRDYPWQGACLTASWSPDGRILASGLQDGSVHFWNVAAATQSQMKGYGAKVGFTSWSANSRRLATAADDLIVVWDFSGRGPEGSTPLQLRAHTARITQLAFQPAGSCLVSGARDHRLLLWQPGQAAEPIDADLLGEEVALLRWSHDGQMLAVGDRAGVLTFYAVV